MKWSCFLVPFLLMLKGRIKSIKCFKSPVWVLLLKKFTRDRFLKILYNLKVSIGTLSPWAKPIDRYGIGIWYPSLSLSYWSQSRKSKLDQIAVCSLRRNIRNDKDVKTTLKSNTKRVRHWCYMLDILFFFFVCMGWASQKFRFF